ncbi:MAG: nitroreductase family protein [Acidobacteria bacterium]|nr:nitroreductase family protein [Acidobacteriota bacterium]MBS1867539.1 nitroreductase family protein [Acidobacteriota bacterium]
MSNPAPVQYPVNDLIKNRWSPRAFSDKPVPKEVLQSLFEAARWAPSSNNEQPWAYIVATKDDAENFGKSLGTLVEFNANWAKKAPVLVIAVAELAFAKNNTPNRNAQYDVGAASLQLSIEATARGLVVHQMAGFDPETAKEVYNIPQGWEPIAAMVIGYPGDASSLPEPYQSREKAPRARKPIREFVMSGEWGHTADFAK